MRSSDTALLPATTAQGFAIHAPLQAYLPWRFAIHARPQATEESACGQRCGGNFTNVLAYQQSPARVKAATDAFSTMSNLIEFSMLKASPIEK